MQQLTTTSGRLRCAVLIFCGFFFLLLYLPLQVAAVDSPYEAAKALIISGGDLILRNEIDEGISQLEKALPLAWESEDGYLVGDAYRWLGIAYMRKGDIKAGHEALNSAIDLFRHFGDEDELLVTLEVAVKLGRNLRLRDTELHYLREMAEVQSELGDFKAQANALDQALNLIRLPEEAELFRDVLLQLQVAYKKTGNEAGMAETWGGLGHYREVTGDVAGALEEYAKAIGTFRKLGRQSDLSMLLNHSAEILRSLGRYREALPLQEEALSIRRTLGDEYTIGQSLNNLALLYQELGEHPLAGKTIEEALAITRKVGTKEDLATALTNAASIYRDLGRFDEGIALLDEVFRIAKEEGLVKERTHAAQILATIHHAQGDPLEAAAAAMVAESLENHDLGKPENSKGDSHNLAISLIGLGRYERAIEILEENLKKAEADHDLLKLADSHEGLAAAYREMDQYLDAESHLLETVQIREKLRDSMGLARSLTNLAIVYVDMGRYYDALDRYGEVLGIVATLQAPRMKIETLLSMSHVYRHLKNFDQALDKAEQALVMSKEDGFGALVIRAQQTLGVIHLHRGDFDQAERFYREASSAVIGHARAVINDGLVEVFLATERFREAEEELARVTPEQLAGASPGYRIQYYTMRGIARRGLGQYLDSGEDFSRAINHVEDIRKQFIGRDSLGFFDAGSYGGRLRPYRGMIETLGDIALSEASELVTVTVGGKTYDPASAAFHYAGLMRGRNLSDRLAFSKYLEARKKMPESLQAEEKRLTDEMKAVAMESIRRKDWTVEILKEQLDKTRKLEEDLRAHLAMLRKDYPQYALLFSPSCISADQVPLSDNEVLLAYAIGLKSVFLFVVKRGESTRLLRLPISVDDLETKVKMFRDLLVAKRFSSDMGSDLFDKLVGQAYSYIRPDDALVIVPDGILGLLPFEALVTTQAGNARTTTYLGTKHRISYVQSSSILALTRNLRRSQAEKAFFGLGDPIFSKVDPRYRSLQPQHTLEKAPAGWTEAKGNRSGQPMNRLGTYSRLKKTKIEVKKIASIMGVAPRPPDVLIGATANETMLRKTDLGAYRIIHFATHAEALGALGLINEPFIVLSQLGNDPEHDGLLTMSEIMDFKLNSSLVVLAACDTGRGDVFEGDGVASLASAFQFAGAESVILSLWELPSKAALSYMETFYRYLSQGKGKAEALQLSRDVMRKKYADPYYWAVFVLYGGVRP